MFLLTKVKITRSLLFVAALYSHFIIGYQNLINNLCSEMAEECTSVAVIPYEEEKIPSLYRQERSFTFNKHKIIIQQDWTNLGVAGVVWDAALVLAKYLENDRLNGLKVIELGAGTGILSIVLAKFGAKVVITDLKSSLQLIQRNVEINFDGEHLDRLEVQELEWGIGLDQFTSDYDIILGADIVYKEETFGDLLITLRNLSRTGTKIYLSSKVRYQKDKKFLDRLSEFFTVNEIYYDKHRDIHIYLAMKKL